MSGDFSIRPLVSSANPVIDVVFIHGLMGDSSGTWCTPKTGKFWPNWLHEDISGVSVYALDYTSSVFEKWFKKEMDLSELGTSSLRYLASVGIGERPIAFITHSLGGVLVKMIIQKSCESLDHDLKQLSQNVRLVCFLATPHVDNSLALILESIVGKFSSGFVKLLSGSNPVLKEVNLSYRNFANDRDLVKTVAYYELHRTGIGPVVSQESANPLVNDAEVIAVGESHKGICKPSSKKSFIYADIKRLIVQVISSLKTDDAPSIFDYSTDYSKHDESDRRSLEEKFIAADRKHEYQLANRYQNEFARHYMRLGLHTPAKEKSEELLSEIEDEFNACIYVPLVCAGASNSLVDEALLKQVIDPICSAHKREKGISRKRVRSALYFLTEQCHIRWDSQE